MGDITIASTWGFDQLLHRNISVVNEKKLYQPINQDDLFTIDNLDPKLNKHSHLMRYNMNLVTLITTPHPEITPEEVKLHPTQKKTEFEFEFVYQNSKAFSVKLAGCFNGW